ncbi:MAG: DUF2007 domain-containing protein [Bacteroidota bacterium]
MAHVKIYAGSEVLVMAVAAKLEDAGIPFIQKDNISSGIAAGFGTMGRAVEVYVDEVDKVRAEELLAGFAN